MELPKTHPDDFMLHLIGIGTGKPADQSQENTPASKQ